MTINIEFLNKLKNNIGEINYNKYLNSLNEDTKHGFSVNLKKLSFSSIDINYLINKFHGELVFINDSFAYIKYDKKYLESINIFPGKDPLYHAGLYYIQEPSAAKTMFDFEINSSDAVLDLCASPGGKSCLALYQLSLKNKGFLLANEIDIKRAKILSSNIERMGFDNCIVISNSPNELVDSFYESFDKIIVDVPCSGEGMFRKSNEARVQWSLSLVSSLSKIQKNILDCAYLMLKKGGKILYSTCTFSKEENLDNINYIIDKYNDISLEYNEIIYPYENFGEGQFFAYLKKDGESSNHITFENVNRINNLKILRYGMKIYELNNNRKEFSHALTHYDNDSLIENSVELDDNEILEYLKGNVIRKKVNFEGFGKVKYKNIGVGLVKSNNGVLKNHYPKGLRNF